MSKLRYFIPVCALLLLVTGCTEQNDSSIPMKKSGEFTDGTYTEKAKGKNGKFDVKVVIKDGVIAKVKIADNKETPDKGVTPVISYHYGAGIYGSCGVFNISCGEAEKI